MLGRNFSTIDTYNSCVPFSLYPTKVLVLIFSMFSFLIRQVACHFLAWTALQYKRWEQWMEKEETQRPIIPIDFMTLIMFTDFALNMPLISPPEYMASWEVLNKNTAPAWTAPELSWVMDCGKAAAAPLGKVSCGHSWLLRETPRPLLLSVPTIGMSLCRF